jgi:hypothetical protein
MRGRCGPKRSNSRHAPSSLTQIFGVECEIEHRCRFHRFTIDFREEQMRAAIVRRLSVVVLATAAVIGGGIFLGAQATFVTYTSRAAFDALGPFTAVDWSVFGPAGTVIPNPDPQTVSGNAIGMYSSQGDLARHDETPLDFNGTFAPGDHLLTLAGSAVDTFVVYFGSPVRGVGTQIDANLFGFTGPYTGFVTVIPDLLGSSNPDEAIFTAYFSGNHTHAEDSSAPFLGIVSSTANIQFVEFWIDLPPDLDLGPSSGAVAINRLDVISAPEPGTLALFAPIVLIGIGMGLWGGHRARAELHFVVSGAS